MPRVVQVNSSNKLDANGRGGDGAEHDENDTEGLNKNHNQQEEDYQDAVSEYLHFPVDYDTYNVQYCPSDNDPYCLRCDVGGEIVKFKKDARVWLHKSSDKKRDRPENRRADSRVTTREKSSFPNSHKDDQDVSGVELKRRLGKIQVYFENVCKSYGDYRTAANVESDISSLGDSEADLTYSEESSPSPSLTNTNLLKTSSDKRVSFATTDEIVMNVDKQTTPVNAASCTSMASNTQTQEDTADMSDIEIDLDPPRREESSFIDVHNASSNNAGRGLTSQEVVRRLAPAIDMDDDSLVDGFLDSAVNAFAADPSVGTSRRSKDRR